MGWWHVELPIGATRLAQGVGRLVRREDDYGVVAVLDPRVANRSYSQSLLNALPPMRRTDDPTAVAKFLKNLAESGDE